MLEGIRIIDFSQYLPGPHTTLRLAEMGAEVIKVEPPRGDPARVSIGKEDTGFVFQAQNRNKKSITLNLKDDIDRGTAINIMKSSDVVIESFRPGVTDRLGIGYADIVKHKQDIIYCSLTGYGQTGSMRQLGGHDLNYMAVSGMLAQLKDETGRPIHPSNTIADFIGGITASEAILGALVKRGRTGEGSYLDISITDSLLPLMSNHILMENATKEQHGVPSLNSTLVCYHIYETKDGRYVSLGALEPKFWKNLCLALKQEHWITEHFSPANDKNAIYVEIKEFFASMTLSEWTQFSLQVDCCLTPVLETSELVNQPLTNERGLIFDKDGIRYTSTKYIQEQADHFNTTQSPPKLGEHNEGIKGTLK